MTDQSNFHDGNGSHNGLMDNRQSESPARTIDSHDSTIDSMDTIVDRSLNREDILTTIEQSTNATNTELQHNGSLTNSQISMLQQHHDIAEEEHKLQQQQQVHQIQQNQHSDAQSHIYSSPVYDEKPPNPMQLSVAKLLEANESQKIPFESEEDFKKHKLITHKEFQQQLEQAMAARLNANNDKSKDANTLDSRISKKQRLPPEFIKIKDTGSEHESMVLKEKKSKLKDSSACCSGFPLQITLGTLQLVLAISLVALGSLLIVREASFATAGCGIWTGLIAAITGALGVVSIRKTQTAFLALSLICIATSTLGLAISGVGLSRDINHQEDEKHEKFDIMNAKGEISGACGLIFALFLHFVVSIVSVYRCALQICSKSATSELKEVMVESANTGMQLDKEKFDQYLRSLSGKEKENAEKLAAMWLYNNNMNTIRSASLHKTPIGARPIMLIPATPTGSQLLPTRTPPPQGPRTRPLLLPTPALLPPGLASAQRGMTLPYMRPNSVIYAHPMSGSLNGTYRTFKSTKSAGQKRKKRSSGNILRSNKTDVNRRQRCRSEADILNKNEAFQYKGLDRAIADSFLAHQEKSNPGSHLDYSSSASSTSDIYGSKAPIPASRASSKTKIICRDIKM